jgi:peptide/nickel transport system permease protein
MLKLVARRLAVLPLILLAVATLTFALTEISPFDPVSAYVGAENNVSSERRAEIAHAWGFDQPIYERFGRWLGNVAQGDLGNSVVAGGQPVANEIASRASASIVLVGGALVLVLVGGLIFGVLAAAFRGTLFDWLVRTLCYFNTAAPSFWIGCSRCTSSRSSSAGCRRVARPIRARSTRAASTSHISSCR